MTSESMKRRLSFDSRAREKNAALIRLASTPPDRSAANRVDTPPIESRLTCEGSNPRFLRTYRVRKSVRDPGLLMAIFFPLSSWIERMSGRDTIANGMKLEFPHVTLI